ncbi:MAG: hypothetical protein ACKOCE_09275 [Acidimicrobiia bacterium]
MRRGLLLLLIVLSACGGASKQTLVLRNADDVQVMSPEEVAAMKATATSLAAGDPNTDPVADDDTVDTIPLNEDNRPAELKLFDAFAEFRGCIEDSGETIRGNLQDPNNPAYQDPEYLQLIQKCAARSDIINVLNEVQSTLESLTPEQIQQRNEGFKLLSDCLKKRGWKIETAVDAQGLINPTRFESGDGSLNDRDINQCLSETGINEAIENGAQ